MSRQASIGTDPDYKNAPKIPDHDQLAMWVQEYRDGANWPRDLIITAHLHLVMSLVSRYSGKRNYHDLIGEALLELTECVTRGQAALKDNEVTPYISASVNFRLRRALAEDRQVRMAYRTFQRKQAQGLLTMVDNTDKNVIGIMSEPVSLDNNVVEGFGYSIPEARRDIPLLEFTEALELAIHTDTERKVVDLKAQGYKDKDFEDVLGLKRRRVGEIVHTIEERFNTIYA